MFVSIVAWVTQIVLKRHQDNSYESFSYVGANGDRKGEYFIAKFLMVKSSKYIMHSATNLVD
jgi:hypothetical protein